MDGALGIAKTVARMFGPKIFRFLKKKYKEHKAQKQQEQQSQGGQPQYQQGPPPGAAAGGAWQQGPPPQQYYQQQQPPPQQQGYYGGPPPAQQPPPSHQAGGWTTSDDRISDDTINLRNQAKQEGDLMSSCFDRASNAYNSGDGGAAKDLSEEGHEHQRRMHELNKQAADNIFREKNANQPRGTIDLHGLYVQESIDKAEEAIRDAQSSGLEELRLIVGKGLHSQSHVAKIKPAIRDLMQKYHLGAKLDPDNAGVLVVDLTGQSGSDDTVMDDMARSTPGDSDKCIIC